MSARQLPSPAHSCCLVQLTAAASIKAQRPGFQPTRLAAGLSREPSAAPASSKAPAAPSVKRCRLLPAPKLCSLDSKTYAVPGAGTAPGCTSATSGKPVARASPAEPAFKNAKAPAAPQLASAPFSRAGVASSSSASDYEDALLAAETGPATPPAMKRTSGAGGKLFKAAAQLLTPMCTSTEAMCRQGAGSRICKVQGGACPKRQLDLPGAMDKSQDVTVCTLPEVPVRSLVSLPMPRAAGHTAEFVPTRGVQSCHFICCLIICVSGSVSAVMAEQCRNCCAARLSRFQLAVASKCTQHRHIAGCSESCP